MATSPVTTEIFPIAFDNDAQTEYYQYEAAISTSWGYDQNYSIPLSDCTYPAALIWIPLPNKGEQPGQGNVSVGINKSFVHTYPVSWTKRARPLDPPDQLVLTCDWSSTWVGKTRIQASFSANRTVKIQYTIIRKNSPYSFSKDSFPTYSQEFDFSIKLSLNEWQDLVSYLQIHDPINWQSWEYTNPWCHLVDAPVHSYTITMKWNNSLNVTYLEKDAYDSGGLIYTIPAASTFRAIMVNKTQELIAKYRDSSDLGIYLIFLGIILGVFVLIIVVIGVKKYQRCS
jgi:hypothetical protein